MKILDISPYYLEKMVLTMGATLPKGGEFPCRLLRTKNHHFANAPFP